MMRGPIILVLSSDPHKRKPGTQQMKIIALAHRPQIMFHRMKFLPMGCA
jgi:hypothetical protein